MVAARGVVFDNQLEHLPIGAPIFTASALVLLSTGRRSQAVDDAARALRLTALMEPIAPWHAVEGRLRLGQTYWQLGDHKRARILTEEARERYVPAARSPMLDQMLKEAERRVAAVDSAPGPSLLTTAELRVLQYLPSHLSFPEIGQRLYLSRHTVKSQALSTYRKLGVSSRSGAVAAASELGLLPPA
jgi:LuxR family maltose regulon positive regulatory protein